VRGYSSPASRRVVFAFVLMCRVSLVVSCRVSCVACRAVPVKVCGYLSHSDCKDKADVNCVIPFLPQTADKVLPPPLVQGTPFLLFTSTRACCTCAVCVVCASCLADLGRRGRRPS
jgi:hypothetical protein